MDFSRGVSIQEEKEFQIQGSWIPVTPGKPIPTKPQPIPAERQGNQHVRTNWLESLGLPARPSQQSLTSNGSAAQFDSMGSVDQNRRINNREAVMGMTCSNRGSANIVGSHSQAFPDANGGWNNVPYANLLAFANAASVASASANPRGNSNAASIPFFPFSYPQINYNQQQPNSACFLLQNQDYSNSSNFWNMGNSQPQIAQYGFPIPCSPTYDLNCQPRKIVDAVSNGATSFQFAPVTPDQGKRIQNQLSNTANLYKDERSHQEKEKQENIATPNRNEVIELRDGGCSQSMNRMNEVIEHCSEQLSHPTLDSSAAISTPLKENHYPNMGDNQGIDLNKTPEQKPKRKKHRPKVIREGKPKRTPKPATPKQASAKQNPSGKRKYVRKKGLKDLDTPSADVLGETIDPPLGTATKSCKRALNFDSESQSRAEGPGTSIGHQEGLPHSRVDSSSNRWAHNLNLQSQGQEYCNGNVGGCENKSTEQLSQGMEVPVNTAASTAYDLNCPTNQLIKDNSSLPEKPAPTTPQPIRRDPHRESLKVLARNGNGMKNSSACLGSGENGHPLMQEGNGCMVFQTQTDGADNHETTVPSVLLNGPQSTSRSQNNSNSSPQVSFSKTEQAKGSKREYCHTIDRVHLHTLNMIGAHYNSLQVYQDILQGNEYHRNRSNLDLHYPEIYKKKKTEIGKSNTTFSSSSSTTATNDGLRQTSQTCHGTSTLQLNIIDNTKELKNGICNPVKDVYAHSIAEGPYCPAHNTSADPLSCTEALSKAPVDKLQTSRCMLSFDHTERNINRRSKGSTQVQELASLTAIPQWNQLPPNPPKTSPTSCDRQGIEIFGGPQASRETLIAENHAKMTTKKGSSLVKTMPSKTTKVCLQEHGAAIYDHRQSLAKSRGQLEEQQPHMVPIEEIIQRLKHLNINGESKSIAGHEQQALVPYSGNGTMVPYEGLFDPTKKRRQRAKVDLDPETNRVWKLLMGKEGSEGIEGMDGDKEKWWEEERRVFRGRADSFIARMHLVQGDRRFSKWKGSVVDSVIGVFLTQNVSDHLSSSAFMSLAARFPLQSKSDHKACFGDGTRTSVEEPEVGMLDTEETIKWHENVSSQPVCDQGSMTFRKAEHIELEVTNSNESFGSNMKVGRSTANPRGKQLAVCESGQEMYHKSPENRTDTLATKTGTVYLVEAEDRRALEDAVSSQNSADSSIFQTTERIGSCSESNSEAEDPTMQSPAKPSNGFDGRTSFMELLQMAGTTMFQEFYSSGSGSSSFNQSPKDEQNQSESIESDHHRSSMDRLDCLKGSFASIQPSNSHHPHTRVPIIPSSKYSLQMTPDSGVLEVECLDVLGEESRSSLPSTASETTEIRDADYMSKQIEPVPETVSETTVQKVPSSAQAASMAYQYGSLNNHPVQPLYSLQPETYAEKNPHSCSNQQAERTGVYQSTCTPVRKPSNTVDTLAHRWNSGMQQVTSSPNSSGEILDVVESTCLVDKQKSVENKVNQSDLKQQVHVSGNSTGTTTKILKANKVEGEKKKAFDWDILRKQTCAKGAKRERNKDTTDSLDWEAVRCADVNEIAKAIKERGMNNMLAERIKDFLNRVVREHGSIDLEWLRDVPPDQVKDYLLSVRGLGLKSVECVRLLTLHHLAFPVDTNVGRIAVRLGWVPLQPLPESLQLHLLELYPMLETIQKYLWPRLCKLDQRTLYELHYQMITFGKVFCTKSKPNCNACPMRGECKHFASAFASARLALPGPEEKSIVSSTVPLAAEQNPPVGIKAMPLPLPEANHSMTAVPEIKKCEPIIEVPATPEPDCPEISESDIEDTLYEDPDEIPTIKLNIEEFTMNLQNYMQQNNMELQEGDMSKALVALTPGAASIPVPKLKYVSRLRTEHQVYELPDSHPLLNGLDRREPDDPCSYLLAIWTPGETAESIQAPERSCGSQESGKLCNEKTCFSCNSIREANSQTVRGTLLIPCRTAMRGSFPLNGTYFQVNEVFADHDSSLKPIDVPRGLIWNLPRRTVFFGTSIPTIFKGLSTEEIQYCFWRGFVCVRGFDQKTRAPRPLMARLHFPASRLAKTKTQEKEE